MGMIRLTACNILILAVMLAGYGCSTTKPHSGDPLAYKNRSISKSNHDITATVALPTKDEAQTIYGVNLALYYIQPVWVEIANHSTSPYWLLLPGLDPNHLLPSEAAFLFHGSSVDSNRQIDEKFRQLHFQNPIMPGTTRSGFVLSNLERGFKAVDIDLISTHNAKNLSFMLFEPDFKADFKMVDFKSLYSSEEITDIKDEDELRRVIEGLPCCTNNADGDRDGDPINLILIGEADEIITALVRRNWHETEMLWSETMIRSANAFLQGKRYRYSPISPLYVFGRRQDIGWQKARSTITRRNHMRFWMSPFRYQGKKVFVGQISRDIDVKFTWKSPTISTHVIDPDVDEARRYFVEDMSYSQAVAKIGYTMGSGVVTKANPKKNLVGDPYYTDGFRAVLFLAPRPYNLSDIEMLDWENPSGHLSTKDASKQ